MAERFNTIAVEVAGRRYAGDWCVQGGRLCVGSAYGSKDAKLGRGKPETLAARLLREVVEAWRAR